MKKYMILFVLILGCSCSMSEGNINLLVNKYSEMIYNTNEYTPSNIYNKNLLDKSFDTSKSYNKIRLMRDTVKEFLYLLDFSEQTIMKIERTPLEEIINSMAFFVEIAKGTKKGQGILDLAKVLKVLDKNTFSVNLKDAAKVKDATDFLRDVIHPDSWKKKADEKKEDKKTAKTVAKPAAKATAKTATKPAAKKAALRKASNNKTASK